MQALKVREKSSGAAFEGGSKGEQWQLRGCQKLFASIRNRILIQHIEARRLHTCVTYAPRVSLGNGKKFNTTSIYCQYLSKKRLTFVVFLNDILLIVESCVRVKFFVQNIFNSFIFDYFPTWITLTYLIIGYRFHIFVCFFVIAHYFLFLQQKLHVFVLIVDKYHFLRNFHRPNHPFVNILQIHKKILLLLLKMALYKNFSWIKVKMIWGL